ncbi:hypothetical protein DYB25_002722 [Aphanomyces astaci]|uniref:Uncharacterized protein n=1 Tax=Aphanomyces astaci TaxID=112090 RepID=A0A397EB40_APHAT|nr:hypothetical protein DYB25_002722 [Aphanomyces astaci]RHY75562.1 hypothetical protein DYB30_008157 [Aphanomyces astaci]RHZ21987.1 hypothetical protein DYB31_005492 [Aphanomyces astaci]
MGVVHARIEWVESKAARQERHILLPLDGDGPAMRQDTYTVCKWGDDNNQFAFAIIANTENDDADCFPNFFADATGLPYPYPRSSFHHDLANEPEPPTTSSPRVELELTYMNDKFASKLVAVDNKLYTYINFEMNGPALLYDAIPTERCPGAYNFAVNAHEYTPAAKSSTCATCVAVTDSLRPFGDKKDWCTTAADAGDFTDANIAAYQATVAKLTTYRTSAVNNKCSDTRCDAVSVTSRGILSSEPTSLSNQGDKPDDEILAKEENAVVAAWVTCFAGGYTKQCDGADACEFTQTLNIHSDTLIESVGVTLHAVDFESPTQPLIADPATVLDVPAYKPPTTADNTPSYELHFDAGCTFGVAAFDTFCGFAIALRDYFSLTSSVATTAAATGLVASTPPRTIDDIVFWRVKVEAPGADVKWIVVAREGETTLRLNHFKTTLTFEAYTACGKLDTAALTPWTVYAHRHKQLHEVARSDSDFALVKLKYDPVQNANYETYVVPDASDAPIKNTFLGLTCWWQYKDAGEAEYNWIFTYRKDHPVPQDKLDKDAAIKLKNVARTRVDAVCNVYFHSNAPRASLRGMDRVFHRHHCDIETAQRIELLQPKRGGGAQFVCTAFDDTVDAKRCSDVVATTKDSTSDKASFGVGTTYLPNTQTFTSVIVARRYTLDAFTATSPSSPVFSMDATASEVTKGLPLDVQSKDIVRLVIRKVIRGGGSLAMLISSSYMEETNGVVVLAVVTMLVIVVAVVMKKRRGKPVEDHTNDDDYIALLH